METLVEIVETMARLGVMSVVELVVSPRRLDALHRLEAAARCVVILVVSHDAPARAERRDRADPLLGRPEVLASLGHRSIDEYLDAPERGFDQTAMQTQFDLPLLRVATDDRYEPPLDDIVDWIVDQTR